MTNWFIPLKETDIEEKIELEKKSGRSLRSTRELLQLELNQHERKILETKHYLNGLSWLDFILKYRQIVKALLPFEIQAQNLREQIAYIDKKLINQ